MLNNELVFLDVDSKNSEEFLSNISDRLLNLGYVKESFKDAIIKREEEFPTAIGAEEYNLAIPHTDSEHVNKPGIAFVRFSDKCRFKEMCTSNEIDVDMAFVLLVTKKEEQVNLLSKLMGIFSQNEFLKELYNENKNEKIIEILNEKIK